MTQEDLAPREYKGPTEQVRKGFLIIYTGDGKGKTTAAMGVVTRCLGRGMKVAVVQFIKGPWISGEVKAFEKFGDQIQFETVGEGFTWNTKDLSKDIASAEKGWARCLDLLRADQYDVYLFDELVYVLKYQFLNVDNVLEGLKLRDPGAHVILTGRDAPAKLVESADLVTEMKEIKHPFQQGIVAQPGIDF